MQAMLC